MKIESGAVNIKQNLRRIKEQVALAARRVGRNPEAIKLIAVTKTVSEEQIRQAVAAGITAVGENRVQEMLTKQPLLPPGLEWHLIGHLQTNKIRYIIGKVYLIHSLDSWRLALAINQWAVKKNVKVEVLVQVNVAGETTKQGLVPNEVVNFIQELATLPGLRVRGLMTIAPEVNDPEEARPVFRELRFLAGRLQQVAPAVAMDYLSMGMSNDYVVAVEEGAN
ncbi:MAG TPA: YggS family pyridoxal phosphate-dependent enzyme, partial [Desulfotomaculum sp.]|nr:YggS family pyridoxal phosphate-dependent enzyme [Desulfotomaculum sp.]